MHLGRAYKLWPLVVLLFLGAPPRAQAANKDPIIRTSEAPVDADLAWTEYGFRLQLRFGPERILQRDKSPANKSFAIGVEPSFRLSANWSLGLGLRYSVVHGDWVGIRWGATADTSWHPSPALSLTLGAGYAGMAVSHENFDVNYKEDGSFTTSDGAAASELRGCDGDGGVALVRVGYLFIVGELFASGPIAQADLQVTRCHGDWLGDDTTRRTEVWWTPSIQVTWALTWR